MRKAVSDFLRAYGMHYETLNLEKEIAAFAAEMKTGLSGDRSSTLMMIPTFLETGGDKPRPETGSDCDAISGNYVSVSPVFNYPAVIRELCPNAPEYAAVSKRSLS